MGAVKRSAPYRLIRGSLPSRCPRDVWLDARTGFVHFEGGGSADPTWFVFAVDLESGAVVGAKRLQSDEGGEKIRITELDRESSAV